MQQQKEPVHTYITVNGQYVVTRHKAPQCTISFDFKTAELSDFASSEQIEENKKDALVKKARAFLKAQVNYLQ